LSLANPTINLADGQLTELSPGYFHVTWNTGEEMWVTDYGNHFDIADGVPLGSPGFIGGLQGFAEGQQNDFQLPDGTVLPQPLTCDTIDGQYADAWRVTQATSLFDYAPGQTTDTFTDKSFPPSCFSLSDLPPDVVAHAMDVVHAAGITDPTIAAEAAYDYIFTGSPTFVSGGQVIQQQGQTGTPATITMDPAPTGAGIVATQPKFVENPTGPTQATFTVFLTQAAAADTVIDFSVVAPDATFLGASAFGGTL